MMVQSGKRVVSIDVTFSYSLNRLAAGEGAVPSTASAERSVLLLRLITSFEETREAGEGTTNAVSVLGELFVLFLEEGEDLRGDCSELRKADGR
mmetsp:Transcript_53112/g.103950  ORF Transcript_53112/g.103950 Transcript_53112/m.103950 type:complete len:94 (-) Transcript_53112:216-497(-)